ncbi:MAG: cellulose binding domain-containing protein [Pseudomonadota bacterium]
MSRTVLCKFTKFIAAFLVVAAALTINQYAFAVVQNGDFSAGTANWTLGRYGGNSAGSIDNARYKILVSQAGSAWWNVQLQQGGQLLQQGKQYRFSFDAFKGPENSGLQQVEVNIGQASGAYTSYSSFPNKLVTLTPTATRYSFVFTMNQPTDTSARIEFNAGLNTGSLYLDNVSLQEVMSAFPAVNASVTALMFGSVPLGESKTQIITLTNSGGAPLNITSISTSSSIFTLEGQSLLSVPAGSSTEINVNYRPGFLGEFTGTLRIDSNAQNQPQLLISLSGNGVPEGTVVGYQPKSNFLINPELMIDFVREIAEFRLGTRDNVNGGFHTFINRDGSPSGANQKSMNGQSRLAYGFTRAFQLTGDDKYLEHAHHALRFLYDHAWQEGWYFVTDDRGVPIANQFANVRWWSFQQHYALLGMGAMVEATGGQMTWGDGAETDLTWLNRGVNSNYNRLWDSDPSRLGYFEYIDRNWTNGTGKGFTPTVDAITTHAAMLATLYDDPMHEQRLRDLADIIVTRFAGNMNQAAVGFPEVFNTNWQIDFNTREADIGHLYKTSWVLLRAYLNNPTRTDYRDTAHGIFMDLAKANTFDKVNGGIYSTLNWQTGELTSSNKNHWKLEQGFNSGMINYYTATNQSDKDIYLQVADGSLDFFMTHMRDTVLGDIWAEVNIDGTVVVDADKGGLFSAGYHSIELGYYTYMYGKLYYQLQPVQLYYKYPVAAQARAIKLTPIDIQDDQLIVTAVERDGVPYAAFNGTTRTLQLPAGTGGKFKVTFARASSPSSSSSSIAVSSQTVFSSRASSSMVSSVVVSSSRASSITPSSSAISSSRASSITPSSSVISSSRASSITPGSSMNSSSRASSITPGSSMNSSSRASSITPSSSMISSSRASSITPSSAMISSSIASSVAVSSLMISSSRVSSSVPGSSSALSSRASSNLSSIRSSTASSATGLAQAACRIRINSEWGQGFNADVEIENLSAQAIAGWQVQVQFLQSYSIVNAWNAITSSSSTAGFSARNYDWNGNIAPGQKVSFGFQANKPTTAAAMLAVKGAICR